DQVEHRLARVEVLPDRRQCDVRDRQVQVGDGGDEDQRDEDEPATIGGSRRGAHPPVVVVGVEVVPSRFVRWFLIVISCFEIGSSSEEICCEVVFSSSSVWFACLAVVSACLAVAWACVSVCWAAALVVDTCCDVFEALFWTSCTSLCVSST